MMKYEPSYLEIFLTKLAFYFFGRRIYKSYADLMPLTGDESVLDFGSGMGTVAYYTAERLPGGYLTCADISERWLTVCRKTMKKYSHVSFLHGDIYSLELSKDSFDLIYCHFVLHDIPGNELIKVLPELSALLKSGGMLAFREPLAEAEKLSVIQRLAEHSGLLRKDRRITDIPLMGNALESIYIKG